jgi:U1 small nuclear ribonucleoprotein
VCFLNYRLLNSAECLYPLLPTTDNPAEDKEAIGDPYKTLFIARLSYQATEEDLRREFSMYGPIERVKVVRAKSGKKKGTSRGYAFILFEREKDMKGG